METIGSVMKQEHARSIKRWNLDVSEVELRMMDSRMLTGSLTGGSNG
jgi:hypothetical protein